MTGKHDYGRGLRWTASTVILALSALALLVAVAPAAPTSIHISQWIVVAQALAFARIGGFVILLIAVTLAVLAIRALRRGGTRRLALDLLSGIIAAGAGIVFIIWPSAVPWTTTTTLGPADGRELTVVVYNSANSFSSSELRELQEWVAADVYVLPEAPDDRVREALDFYGREAQVFATLPSGFTQSYPPVSNPTTVVVRSDIGILEQVPTAPTLLGSVELVSESGPQIRLMGVHPSPPVPGRMENWRTDIDTVMSTPVDDGETVIVAGDMNATLRHGPLAESGELVDAAAVCGTSGHGTWPVPGPKSLTPAIDHVFVSRNVEVVDCKTARIGSADHRALAVTVRVPS